MRRTRLATLSLALCFSATAAACASNTPPTWYVASGSAFGDALISGDEIDAQHQPNAWLLLRKVAPRYSYLEDRMGRAVLISRHRGRSSIVLNGSEIPMVIVDGARISSLDVLQGMPTDAIDRIELLSSARGTSVQGTNATAGVIHIHTRWGS